MRAALAIDLVAPSAGAESRRPGAVLVLEASNDAGWKEGVQALVAELLTTGYELSVRAARAQSLEQLEQELQFQVAESGATAGVSVTREGTNSTTLLCRHDAPSCEHLETEIADSELSRSRLALAVVGRLRPLDLPSPPERPAPPPPPRPPAPRVERPIAPPPALPSAHPHRVWLGGGAVLTSGPSEPLSWLGASLALKVAQPWGIEVGFGGSPWRASAETHAGSVTISGVQAVGFATFEPWSGPHFGFSLGAGGGALWLQETAAAAPGFEGFSRHATVGLISARARVFRRFGPVSWGLSVDPGLLVPAVKIVAGTETVLQVGRPWVSLQTSLGVEL